MAMILGYVDTDDRVYDLGFATLRMRIRIEPAEAGGSQVVFSQAGGEGAVAYRVAAEEDVTLAVGMDHGGDLVPLLRPVEGRLVRHEKGVLFIASPSSRDEGEPSFFLVKVRAMPSAVKFFFEDRGGTELVSIPVDEVLRMETVADRVRVSVSAANIALPKEKLSYAVDVAPASKAADLLHGHP
ncbi:MAG: hypothetical protein A3K59_09925 [Euryarchaeota archaeon RBG_19FT_COMBO_69_17]|nr:MAG: hypothetical protein A3K59_09925 [Euryarchaeota archaeon RBG_19FT_COMBO_69_17]